MEETLSIVDHNGKALRVWHARGEPAHAAASNTSAELASWHAPELGPDSALLPDLAKLRGRNHDLVRNNGFISGAVQTHLDNIIGTGLRLNVKPDWRYLGIKDKVAAAEWERDTQVKFCNWAYDVNNYCDASRRKNFAQMLAQAYRSYLTSFEICGTSEWIKRPDSKFRTAIQLIDPMRLSNPNGTIDTATIRGGIELGPMGEPIAAHISSRSEQNYLDFNNPMQHWTRVPMETKWGRRLFLHRYDEERAGQTRGKTGIVSVLAKVKMLEKFEQATLQAAILNAMYAAVIQSSLDWNAVAGAMGGMDTTDPTAKYVSNKSQFHSASGIRFNGVKIPHLYPGEELKMMATEHPTAQFGMFEEAVLRNIAAGCNLTYEQLSHDYSKSNYSSSRAGMLEAWRFFSGRHVYIAAPFATDIYALWLEEATNNGEVELPAGAPDFYEAKTAWCKCKWIGPGRGHIDPEKEANANKILYGMQLTTLEDLAAEQGKDWEELLEQRNQETARMDDLGIDAQAILNSALDAKPAAPAGAKPAAPGEPAVPAAAPESKPAATAPAYEHPPAQPVQVNVAASAPADNGAVMAAFNGLRSEVALLQQNMLNDMREEMDQRISMPVVPIYDAKGNFLGAKRVTNEEFERIQLAKKG